MGQKYSKLEWAKRFRKIPASIDSQLEEMGDERFVVACSKEFLVEDFQLERYVHLDILDETDLLEEWTSLIPSPNIGKTSYLNCEVSEEIDKKAGKVSKKFASQAPDWKGAGMHEIKFTKEVWAKKLIPPIFSQIGFRLLDSREEKGRILVHFEVHELFHLKIENLDEKLLRALNLLQENVGKIGLSQINESDRERIGELSNFVGWSALEFHGLKDIWECMRIREWDRNFAKERLNGLLELKPLMVARGSHAFAGYLGFRFTDDLVVFADLARGSCLYAVESDWESFLSMSREELILAHTEAQQRITHKDGWFDKLRTLVLKERGEPLDDQTLLDL